MKNGPREIWWFTQHAGGKNPRAIRDGAPFVELLGALGKAGHHFGGQWLNHPAQSPGDRAAFRFFDRRHILVLSTRPALSDDDPDGGSRKKLKRTGAPLEDAAVKSSANFFVRVVREHVVLQKPIADALGPHDANRANLGFCQYARKGTKVSWAFYKEMQHKPAPRDLRATAAYLTFVPELWRGGPALLNVFGMGGNETLLWCHMLRTRHSELLTDVLASVAPRFVMAELSTREAWHSDVLSEPGRFPTLGAFAGHWEVRILVDVLSRRSTSSSWQQVSGYTAARL
jgi:hypothetical protein